MTGIDDYVFEASAEPPGSVTPERIAAFYAEIEAAKRILVCASDVYQRAKAAVEASAVAGLFEVVENPWLDDGQVLSIDPTLLEPPPFEFVMPDYRCGSCAREIPLPGLCGTCKWMAGLLYGPRPSVFSPIIAPPTGI